MLIAETHRKGVFKMTTQVNVIAGRRYVLADGAVTGPIEDYGMGWTCDVACNYWNYDGSHDVWDNRQIVKEYVI